jgi:hypothetical protein
MSEKTREPPTLDRFRDDIDRGLEADKVPGFDPAAAPLGTDAEAGGFPPTRWEREVEAQSGRAHTHAAHTQASKRSGSSRWVWIACLLVLLLLVVGVVGSW